MIKTLAHIVLISTLIGVGGFGVYRLWNGEPDPLHDVLSSHAAAWNNAGVRDTPTERRTERAHFVKTR